MSKYETIPDADFDLLSAYIDNDLSPDERVALEARLQREPKLQQTLDELRATVGMLRELEPVRSPRSFTLEAAIVQPSRSVWQLPATWMRLGSAVAALLLAITLTLDVGGGGMSTATQVPANAGSGGSAATAVSGFIAPTMMAAAESVPAAGARAAATQAPAAIGAPSPKQPDITGMAATEATAAAASGDLGVADAPADAANSAMSSASAPEGATGSAPAEESAPMAQSSGSSSPDTTNLQSYQNEEPQIVAPQPRSLFVLQVALGALALLLLAASFWIGRRKA